MGKQEKTLVSSLKCTSHNHNHELENSVDVLGDRVKILNHEIELLKNMMKTQKIKMTSISILRKKFYHWIGESNKTKKDLTLHCYAMLCYALLCAMLCSVPASIKLAILACSWPRERLAIKLKIKSNKFVRIGTIA